jgi:hypothetical protein
METNPRSPAQESGPGAWAPPPPVVLPEQRRATPPPLPPMRERRISAEADFEATLGSLVDQFANLPPAEYGEAPELPELAAEPQSTRSRRDYLWWGAGSLVLGAALAGGVIAGFHLIHKNRIAQAQPAAVTRPEVPINVKAAAPAVEPLADEAVPQASALPDEPTPAPVAAAAPTPTPRKKVVHRAPRRARAAAVSSEAKPTKAREDGWEDPYK